MTERKNENEVLLLSGLSTMEADIIISKLKSFGIPVLKKTRGTGQLMEIFTGSNPYGTDLYVASDMLEIALELVEGSGEEQIDEHNEETEETEETEDTRDNGDNGDTKDTEDIGETEK